MAAMPVPLMCPFDTVDGSLAKLILTIRGIIMKDLKKLNIILVFPFTVNIKGS